MSPKEDVSVYRLGSASVVLTGPTNPKAVDVDDFRDGLAAGWGRGLRSSSEGPPPLPAPDPLFPIRSSWDQMGTRLFPRVSLGLGFHRGVCKKSWLQTGPKSCCWELWLHVPSLGTRGVVGSQVAQCPGGSLRAGHSPGTWVAPRNWNGRPKSGFDFHGDGDRAFHRGQGILEKWEDTDPGLGVSRGSV